MGLYQRLQGRADALIRKYGKKRTVTHTEVGEYNPDTGKNALVVTTFQVPIVTFPYEVHFIDGTTVKENDLWALFSAIALPVVPQPGDKLDIEGNRYTFGTVKPLNPGGVNIYFEAHLNCG